MQISRATLVFFDASCLIAAAGRREGGSGFVLSLCERGLLQGAVSLPVLQEAQNNIEAKLPAAAMTTFRRLLVDISLTVAPVPDLMNRESYRSIVGEKDDHVLAAARASDAIFLLTLDKRLAARINGAALPIRALSPGEFIKGVLPHHEEYPSLRA